MCLKVLPTSSVQWGTGFELSTISIAYGTFTSHSCKSPILNGHKKTTYNSKYIDHIPKSVQVAKTIIFHVINKHEPPNINCVLSHNWNGYIHWQYLVDMTFSWLGAISNGADNLNLGADMKIWIL